MLPYATFTDSYQPTGGSAGRDLAPWSGFDMFWPPKQSLLIHLWIVHLPDDFHPYTWTRTKDIRNWNGHSWLTVSDLDTPHAPNLYLLRAETAGESARKARWTGAGRNRWAVEATRSIRGRKVRHGPTISWSEELLHLREGPSWISMIHRICRCDWTSHIMQASSIHLGSKVREIDSRLRFLDLVLNMLSSSWVQQRVDMWQAESIKNKWPPCFALIFRYIPLTIEPFLYIIYTLYIYM